MLDQWKVEALARIAEALEHQNRQNQELIELRKLEVSTHFRTALCNTEAMLLVYGRPEYPTPEEREAWQAEEKPINEARLATLQDALKRLESL